MTNSITWTRGTAGIDTAIIGRYTVQVHTGASYLDPAGGHELASVYIPTTDRELVDGAMLVSRRPLGTTQRATALGLAETLARAAIADYEAIRR